MYIPIIKELNKVSPNDVIDRNSQIIFYKSESFIKLIERLKNEVGGTLSLYGPAVSY